MRWANEVQKPPSPTADLIPTGRPVRVAIVSTRSSSESTSVNARVARRALAVDAHGDAADRGDLRGDLRPGEHPAEARLGTLAELELDGSHARGGGHRVHQALDVEAPSGVRHPK
jgi:hypothetical protein